MCFCWELFKSSSLFDFVCAEVKLDKRLGPHVRRWAYCYLLFDKCSYRLLSQGWSPTHTDLKVFQGIWRFYDLLWICLEATSKFILANFIRGWAMHSGKWLTFQSDTKQGLPLWRECSHGFSCLSCGGLSTTHCTATSPPPKRILWKSSRRFSKRSVCRISDRFCNVNEHLQLGCYLSRLV